MDVKDIAIGFRFDPDFLEKELSTIKSRYEKRKKGYETYLNETKLNELINDISKRAKDLAYYLNSLPVDVREALNSVCPRQITANHTTGKVIDSGLTPNSESYIDDTIGRLKKIVQVTSTLDVHTYTESRTKRTMHHRDSLLIDFRDSWERLSGTPPSRSSKTNLFVDYMEWACEYMDIDYKGLGRKHLDSN
jgi:hypothetical protein